MVQINISTNKKRLTENRFVVAKGERGSGGKE